MDKMMYLSDDRDRPLEDQRCTVNDVTEFAYKPSVKGHAVILGPTRQGMSVAANLLQRQAAAAGGSVHTMDVGLTSEAFKRQSAE